MINRKEPKRRLQKEAFGVTKCVIDFLGINWSGEVLKRTRFLFDCLMARIHPERCWRFLQPERRHTYSDDEISYRNAHTTDVTIVLHGIRLICSNKLASRTSKIRLRSWIVLNCFVCQWLLLSAKKYKHSLSSITAICSYSRTNTSNDVCMRASLDNWKYHIHGIWHYYCLIVIWILVISFPILP